MRIVVTDTGNIWNHENPFLEQFKDIVLVVCLNGKEVTDKYECFVSPYKQVGMGIDKYGDEDNKFKALASAAGKLNSNLRYHDDIVFLTDDEPSTLYPFYAIRNLNEYNGLHLIAMSPWEFEGNRRIEAHNKMLDDLSALNSLLYYDSTEALKALGEKTTLPEVYEYTKNYFSEIMITVLNGIHKMRKGPCFFDFSTMKYVPVNDGFSNVKKNKKTKLDKKAEFEARREFCTLGLIMPPSYPEEDEYTKKKVETLPSRLDGKKVCNVLREQRLLLAEANGIPFESEACPTIGPCAGTCEKCDMESKYLRKQLQKIPEDKRVYPKFDPKKEVQS